MARQISTETVTITNGTSVSSAAEKSNATLVGVAMSADWTAADITLQASVDGTTWLNVKTADGTEYALTVAADEYIIVPHDDLLGGTYIRLRSGTGALPVNQGAERVLTLFLAEA